MERSHPDPWRRLARRDHRPSSPSLPGGVGGNDINLDEVDLGAEGGLLRCGRDRRTAEQQYWQNSREGHKAPPGCAVAGVG